MGEKKLSRYRPYYSEEALGSKLLSSAKAAGMKVVYYALILYNVLISGKTPFSDRLKIVGALGYFILPTDVLPDFIPALGYTDDLAALAWCIYSIAKNITPEIKEKASAQVQKLFSGKSGMRGSNS